MKVLWIVLILVLPVIGVILYLLVDRNNKKNDYRF
jgi:heme/copper-type cytochrome/quinol oxidase subunit 2